jgi:hypothetical protein
MDTDVEAYACGDVTCDPFLSIVGLETPFNLDSSRARGSANTPRASLPSTVRESINEHCSRDRSDSSEQLFYTTALASVPTSMWASNSPAPPLLPPPLPLTGRSSSLPTSGRRSIFPQVPGGISGSSPNGLRAPEIRAGIASPVCHLSTREAPIFLPALPYLPITESFKAQPPTNMLASERLAPTNSSNAGDAGIPGWMQGMPSWIPSLLGLRQPEKASPSMDRSSSGSNTPSKMPALDVPWSPHPTSRSHRSLQPLDFASPARSRLLPTLSRLPSVVEEGSGSMNPPSNDETSRRNESTLHARGKVLRSILRTSKFSGRAHAKSDCGDDISTRTQHRQFPVAEANANGDNDVPSLCSTNVASQSSRDVSSEKEMHNFGTSPRNARPLPPTIECGRSWPRRSHSEGSDAENVSPISPYSHSLDLSVSSRSATSFDPRVWVCEFRRHPGEQESTWYNQKDLMRFKRHAARRILSYNQSQQAAVVGCMDVERISLRLTGSAEDMSHKKPSVCHATGHGDSDSAPSQCDPATGPPVEGEAPSSVECAALQGSEAAQMRLPRRSRPPRALFTHCALRYDSDEAEDDQWNDGTEDADDLEGCTTGRVPAAGDPRRVTCTAAMMSPPGCIPRHVIQARINMEQRAHLRRSVLLQELHTVLLVDPHDLCRRLFRKSLLHILPHAFIISCSSGKEALAALETSAPSKECRVPLEAAIQSRFDMIIVEERLSIFYRQEHQDGSGSGSSAEQTEAEDRLHALDNPASGSGFLSSASVRAAKSASSSARNIASPQGSFFDQTVVVGVSSRPDEDSPQFREAGADFVWGKPPPQFGESLLDDLLKCVLKKRGKTTILWDLFSNRR